MHGFDLEMLIREFQHGTAKEDELIRMELSDIARLYGKCGNDEVYSAAIVSKFCSVIRTLNRKHEQELYRQQECSSDYLFSRNQELSRLQYVGCTSEQSYQEPDSLLLDFYNHFRNEKKIIRKEKDIDFPELPDILCLRGGPFPINPTMKDYAARIKTFARQYLPELLARDGLDIGRMNTDPILYTYENIEVVLAKFDTVVETANGEKQTDKQRVNIRSALRKLNEFKRAKERR